VANISSTTGCGFRVQSAS